jgi:hypothetical protein
MSRQGCASTLATGLAQACFFTQCLHTGDACCGGFLVGLVLHSMPAVHVLGLLEGCNLMEFAAAQDHLRGGRCLYSHCRRSSFRQPTRQIVWPYCAWQPPHVGCTCPVAMQEGRNLMEFAAAHDYLGFVTTPRVLWKLTTQR